jgi:hypothetical protein
MFIGKDRCGAKGLLESRKPEWNGLLKLNKSRP